MSGWAHNAALHVLARPKQYELTEDEKADVLQVALGFTSPYDEAAARRGLELLREFERRQGRTPRF